MTKNNNDINTKLADDTTTTLSLQNADQNSKDEWMDTGNNNIDGTIQQIDYKDELKEKNPPSAIKS
eukprot:3639968-Ditylum_brightwellii.AAC.1